MTFVILFTSLTGLTLIFSAIEDQSLADYLASWIGGSNGSK